MTDVLNIGSTSVLIVNKDGLIVGVPRRDNPNDWGIPGGRRESNEYTIECALRELKEETSIVIHENDCILLYVGRARVSICATFLIMRTTNIVPGPGDCGISKWVSWDYLESGTFGIYNKILHQRYNEFIELYGNRN